MSKPIRVLLLDTETNGLPTSRQAPPARWEFYPALLQISWAIYEIEGPYFRPISKRDIGVALHPSIPWNAGAARVHGITEPEARCGTPAYKALQELGAALREVSIVVAHNMDFDKPIIRAAAYAEADRGFPGASPADLAALRALWPTNIQELCTMRTTKNIIKIPSPYYADKPDAGIRYKVPKLNEVYTWLYGHPYDVSGASLHNAKSDTHCLAQCVSGLLRKGYASITDGRLTVCDPDGE
jgi:DNA polymerase III epsilon subunit-like protein